MSLLSRLKITEDDLHFIFGDEYSWFRTKIVPNCFCHGCAKKVGPATITSYEITINDLNDLELCGKCADCGGQLNRYVETGEGEEHVKKIHEVRKKYAR